MIDESSTRPLYRQAAKQIAEEIASGVRPANSIIPSERELAEEFNISRMTARAAVNALVQQGLVVRRNRARAQVAQPKFRFDFSSPEGLHDQLLKAGVTPGAKIIVAEKVPASSLDPKIGQALALSEQEEVYRIIRLRTADGESIAVENSYFPAKLFPDLLDFNLTDSIYGILKKHFAVKPVKSVQDIEITLLETRWADIMNTVADLPTLEVKRYAVTADNTPFEFAHDIYRGDRLIFTAQTLGPSLNLGTTAD